MARTSYYLFCKYILCSFLLIFPSDLLSSSLHELSLIKPDAGEIQRSLYLGVVHTRSIVHDPDTGYPLWATYNSDGGHTKLPVRDLAEASTARVMSGSNIRNYIEQLARLNSDYGSEVELLEASLYESVRTSEAGFRTYDDQPISNLPAISQNTIYVALPAKSRRLHTNGREIEVLQFPFDIETNNNLEALINTKTVLVSRKGEFLEKSEERIGHLTAFLYGPDGKVADTSEYSLDAGQLDLLMGDGNQSAIAPLSNVTVSGTSWINTRSAVTDSNGKYHLEFIYSCLLKGFVVDTILHAEMYYSVFHPKGVRPAPYWVAHRNSDGCIAYADPTHTDLLSTEVLAYQGGGKNIHHVNFGIAASILSGNVRLKDVEINDEPTRYFAEQSPNEAFVVQQDYNGDGIEDQTVRGDFDDQGMFIPDPVGSLYGVYIKDENATENAPPDFTRIIDRKPHLMNQGLVKSINKEDMEKTDIFVFRESTGELIAQREGIPASELSGDGGEREQRLNERGEFTYIMPIRSPENIFHGIGDQDGIWAQWQSSSGFSPEFHSRRTDFIRVGEQIKVGAINRATGYMGSVVTTMTPTAEGDIGVYVPTIELSPPNLKLWAERLSSIEGGRAGDQEVYTISNEGAGTTKDEYISVFTEWLDSNGLPLPQALSGRGYTGRLVKVASDDPTNPYQTRSSEFPINPGLHRQTLKFSEGSELGALSNYHFYLQVNAETDAEQNDFQTGAHEGVLRHRPNRYVPVKVPIFDEQRSEYIDTASNMNDEELENSSVYSWVYRPELSYSVVDLAVQEINLYSKDPEEDKVNIIDSEEPVITSDTDIVEILYLLSDSEYDRITPLDGEQEFILAFGEEEIVLTVDRENQQTIQFTNIEHLYKLEPEDYQSIRFYLNGDSRNILWEWAFETFDMDMDTDNNNGYDEPERTNEEELAEIEQDHPGKIIYANVDDINGNEVPDYAEFIYEDKQGQIIPYKFTPLVIEIPPHVNVEEETSVIVFEYAGSNPLEVEKSENLGTEEFPEYEYTPAPGNQRIWLKNADELRNPNGVMNETSGHYVAPDLAIPLNKLGYTKDNRVVTYYIEGIKAGSLKIRTVLEYQI